MSYFNSLVLKIDFYFNGEGVVELDDWQMTTYRFISSTFIILQYVALSLFPFYSTASLCFVISMRKMLEIQIKLIRTSHLISIKHMFHY